MDDMLKNLLFGVVLITAGLTCYCAWKGFESEDNPSDKSGFHGADDSELEEHQNKL